MKGISRRGISLVVLVAVVMTMVAMSPVAGARTAFTRGTADAPGKLRVDDKPSVLADKQAALREVALEAKLNGKKYGKIAAVARGQYVRLELEGEDPVWTVPGEFADFPHNNIAEPDRTYDNSTIWVPDFSEEYFDKLLFDDAPGANSMRNYFLEQSSGRYTVYGDVTEWVPVPGNAADYDDSPDANVWNFLRDSLNGWYDMQVAKGMTPAEIDAYLAEFDLIDRYDWDMDGNFYEPDGYIDHFQSLHAGEGEEAGGGALGDLAIWSHSWYAEPAGIGSQGPSSDYLLGGIQVGDSGYWIGDYTIQPENGGVGVFTHEFTHDLGLPDMYDYYGENGTGFWTLMSSGSWLSDSEYDIGSKPNHLTAWEKFQLGWLNYEVARYGVKSQHKLGPAEYTTKQAQGLFVILPKKEVVNEIAEPYAGEYFYYSGSGDNLNNFMYRPVTLAPGSSLTAKVNLQIEEDWDYAYLVVSTDGGATWASVETNLSRTTNPYGQNFGYGITGWSSGWVDLSADLSAFTGDVLVGFRYWTDVAYIDPGFMVDEIAISGEPVYGAESADEGWTFVGFRRSTGTETGMFSHYYVAEFRQYKGYDATMKVGPYNFGFLDDPMLGNFVERFPYQDGLLISYWDTSVADNNTGLHPGRGLVLPIDAHPDTMYRADGKPWRNRVQSYDATFGFEKTDPITLHYMSQPSYHESLPAVPVFNDLNDHYNEEIPLNSVMHPHTGTMIKIVSYSAQGNFLQLQVAPVK